MILDDNADSLVGAWGTYRLLSAYSGDCLSAHNGTTQIDVGFAESGIVDVASVIAHGAECRAEWYNQSGTTATLTQATVGDRPLIVTASAPQLDHQGVPNLKFSSEYISTTNAAIKDAPLGSFSLFWVSQFGSTNVNCAISWQGTDDIAVYPNDSLNGSFGIRTFWRDRGGSFLSEALETPIDNRVVVYGITWDGTTFRVWRDNDVVFADTLTAGTEGPFDNFGVGGFALTQSYIGLMRAVAVYNADKTADRQSIMDALRGGSLARSVACNIWTYGPSDAVARTGDAGGTSDATDLREFSNVLRDATDPDSDYRYKLYYTGIDSGSAARTMHLVSSPDGETWANRGQVYATGYTEDPYIIDLGSGVYWCYAESSGSGGVKLLESTDYGITWAEEGTISITSGGSFSPASPAVWLVGDTIYLFVENLTASPFTVHLLTGSVSGGGLTFANDGEVIAIDGSGVVPDQIIQAGGVYYIHWHSSGGGSSGWHYADTLTGPWTEGTTTLGALTDANPWEDAGGTTHLNIIRNAERGVIYQAVPYKYPSLENALAANGGAQPRHALSLAICLGIGM